MVNTFVTYLAHEKARSECTVTAYKKDLETLFQFLQVEPTRENVAMVTTNDIRAWASDMMQHQFLARSVNRRLSAARSFFRYMRLLGVIEKNPAEYVPALKTPRPLPVYFKEEEVDKATQIPEGEETDFESVRDALVIELLYQTGMRRAELAGLKDVDVDTSGKTIKILGKGRKERIVPFGDDLEKKIQYYIALRSGVSAMTPGRLLIKRNGEPLSVEDIYNIVVRRMGEVSTLEKHSPHVLRHTFATTMLNNGADLDSVKELLGHSSLATTQIYTHVTFEQMLESYHKAHPHAKSSKDDETNK